MDNIKGKKVHSVKKLGNMGNSLCFSVSAWEWLARRKWISLCQKQKGVTPAVYHYPVKASQGQVSLFAHTVLLRE